MYRVARKTLAECPLPLPRDRCALLNNRTMHYVNAVKAIASSLAADQRSFAGYYRRMVYTRPPPACSCFRRGSTGAVPPTGGRRR